MSYLSRRERWSGRIARALLAATVVAAGGAASAQVRISQVYGGGGLVSTGYNADFVELYNAGASPVALTGQSLQVSASATGTAWTVVPLSGSIAPNGYFLVRLETATATGQIYTPDLVASPLAAGLTSGAGKVALVGTTTTLTGSGCPIAAPIIDLVSYTTSTTATGCFEGSVGNAVTVAGGGSSVVRKCGGARDTDDNRNDFVATLRAPRNAASGPNTDANQITLSLTASPAAVAGGQQTLFTAPASVCTGSIAGVTINLSAVGGSATQPLFDNGTNGDATAGDGIYSYRATIAGSSGTQSITATATASGGGTQTASTTITIVCDGYNTPVAGAAPIEDISTSPSATQLALGDDASSAAVTLPFTFRFFGVTKPALIINANGWLGFDTTGTQPTASQTRVPVVPLGSGTGSTNPPNDFIAVYWRDLNQNPTGGTQPQTISYEIRGTAPRRRFIAQWQVAQFSNTGYNQFEAILYEGSDAIELRYGTFATATSNTTFGAGLENATGTAGLDIPATSIANNSSYIITPAPGSCSAVTYPSGACCAGASCTSGTQAACQVAGGSYQGNATTCSPNPCVVGACCATDGSCSVGLQSVCQSAGGFYQGNQSACGGTPCPPIGRCCTGTSCSAGFQSGCTSPGVWTNGGSCSPNLCAGSCCDAGGVCALAASAGSCSGTFGGAGSTCTPSPCPGQSCSSPIPIAVNQSLDGDLAASTSTSTISCSTGLKGLWYTFTAPSAGSYSIVSTLTTGTGNPSLGVFRPCGTELACQNPCGGTVTTATVTLNAADTIVFRAGGCGDIQLTWSVRISQTTLGACCNASSGACASSTSGSAGCAAGTTYQGDNTTCSPNPCPQPPPPANDDCAGALPLTAGTPRSGTITHATGAAITGGCTGTDVDVWYTFTPTVTGGYSVLTTPASATDAATSIVVGVGGGACPFASTADYIACSAQPGAGATNTVTFSATAGTTYFVRLGAFVGDTGAFSVLVNTTLVGACCNTTTGACTSSTTGSAGCASGTAYQGDNTTCSPNPCPQPPPPANDECSGSNPALTVGVALTGSSVNATNSGAIAGASCPGITASDGGSRDVFVRFIPPATAAYEIDTCGSGFDTVLSIHSGCPATDANLLACNDDSSQPTGNVACTDSQLRSRIQSVTLTAGTTYTIRIAGFAGATGAYSVIANLVSATGSCCNGAACTLTDAANCSGTFTSGATCSGGACGGSGGVCCRGATCNATVAQASCTGSGTAGAAFVAAAPACNSAGSTTAPCCYANYNKVNGISVQDIFDFLTDWFAGSPFASVGGNGTPGPLNVQNIFDFLNAWFAGGCS